MEFKEELIKLINKHSLDNDTNTPDYLLADFIVGVIANYALTKRDTDKWNGQETK